MLPDTLGVLLGLLILSWGAERFVTGAAALASNLGVSPMLIGLTIVAFGTSAPEILVSMLSALEGNPGLAIGNALGSNIANIGLILGTTALIIPLAVNSRVLKREYPVLLLISALSLLIMLDGGLDRSDGLILLFAQFVLLGWFIYTARSGQADPIAREYAAKIPHGMPTGKAIFLLFSGLLALLAGSRLLVWGAINIANAFGVSDLIIGLTIVALGTSLPELATSIAGGLKGKDDLAIGNIIGSNLYNLLAVLSLPGLIAPGPFAREVLQRDQPMMLGLTLALFFMSYGFGRQGCISRLKGLLLLLAFIGYQTLLFFTLERALH